MRLSNILSLLRNNFFVITIVIATWVFAVLPLLHSRFSGVFYTVDPDAVYTGNAISYAKFGKIYYTDHPGTPSIRFLAHALFPIRVAAKVIFRQPFLVFVISHYRFIFSYLRLIESIVFATAFLLIIGSVYRFSKSAIIALFAWLYLLSFFPTLYFGLAISAEPQNMFFLGAWLGIFLHFYKERHPLLFLSLCFLAGLALSNRLTNAFLIPASVLCAFYLQVGFKYKLRNLLPGAIFSVLGFLLGSWQIMSRYKVLFNWVLLLASTSRPHGGGSKGVFVLEDYIISLKIFAEQNTWLLLLVIVFFIFLTVRSIMTRRIEIQTTIGVIGVLGMAVFAKYPLAHYQTTNIILCLAMMLVFLDKFRLKQVIALFMVVALISPSAKNVISYNHDLTKMVAESTIIDNVAKRLNGNIVWEWSVSRDFALLWGNGWTVGSYQPYFTIIRPELYQMGNDYKTVYDHNGNLLSFVEKCPNYMMIQTNVLPEFKKLNPDIVFNSEVIRNTRMSILNIENCQPLPGFDLDIGQVGHLKK